MKSTEDRRVYPPEGDDPPEIDEETTDAAAMAAREKHRAVRHDQDAERDQGLTSDKPGTDASSRHAEPPADD